MRNIEEENLNVDYNDETSDNNSSELSDEVSIPLIFARNIGGNEQSSDSTFPQEETPPAQLNEHLIVS